ncbi:regulator of microtubule dynamics protein 3 isoform X1 [Alosa pseudoharengus]|uniref:regulator of microtubule dynamics protein 3 isoform X1 n=1 Tax=Alosa pseudoharengus TaxID=34774 RepID=UPI003F8C8480
MLASGIMNTFGKNGLIGLGIGATAGAGLVGFLIYKEVSRKRNEDPEVSQASPSTIIACTDDVDRLHAPALDLQDMPSEVAALGSALQGLQGLSPEQQVELKNRLDDVLMCVTGLRSEVSELRSGLQDIAQKIIEDVKKGLEESQRARRRRHLVPRERTDSMSSSSIYFSASAGPASTYGGTESEAGYSTAYAESDYTDRETDRETDKEGDREDKESDEEDDEDRSVATVLTLRQEDSQAEEEDEEDADREWPTMATMVTMVTDVPSGELALLLSQSDLLHEGDSGAKKDGFNLLHTNKLLYSDSTEFLWRLARAYNDMYEITEDKEEKKSYAEQGRDEAEAALNRNGLNAECHKWFAVLTGLNSQYESMHGKLKSSHILKEHLDRAIALRDDDPLCFYLLGRWCYEVSMLGWLEKKAAAALYESPPSSTVHEALEHFLKAEELSPGFSKTVRVYIAKCHKELGNTSEASNWARLAIQMPSVTSEETGNSTLEEELKALIDTPSDLSPSNGDF